MKGKWKGVNVKVEEVKEGMRRVALGLGRLALPSRGAWDSRSRV